MIKGPQSLTRHQGEEWSHKKQQSIPIIKVKSRGGVKKKVPLGRESP